MKQDYNFHQNKDCRYFPCHPGADPETFSCLFCYCPLYALGDNCGGNFTYTAKGVKNCTSCLRPHQPENYEIITGSVMKVIDMVRKTPADPEQK